MKMRLVMMRTALRTKMETTRTGAAMADRRSAVEVMWLWMKKTQEHVLRFGYLQLDRAVVKPTRPARCASHRVVGDAR